MKLSSKLFLFSVASFLVTPFANLQAKECSGVKKISGPAIGCKSYKSEEIRIDLSHCNFDSTPRVNADTFAASPNDKVFVELAGRSTSEFILLVTTSGKHGNRVCDNTGVKWTAKE